MFSLNYRLKHLLLFSTFVAVLPMIAHAECSCPVRPEIRPAFEDSTVCFLGKVEKIGKNPLRPKELEVRFRVIESYKEIDEAAGEFITVRTPAPAEGCNYGFTQGYEYLVYAKGSPANLITDSCGRTALLDSSQEERTELLKIIGRDNNPPEQVSAK